MRKVHKTIQKTNKKRNGIWDDSWEKVFQTQEWGKYPPEELIRFTAKNFYKFPKRSQIKFLDLGCGPGACSWYLARERFSINGIDGSKSAITKAKKLFKNENLEGDFRVMDYVELDFPDNYFDAVIDIASIQHNRIENVPTVLNEVNRVLKLGGKFFSIIVANGTIFEPYRNKGYVHFYRFKEIEKFFKIFKILSIERNERTENMRKDKIIHWIVTCEK